MTSVAVGLHELLATRHRLMQELPRALTPRHRQFLLSMVCAEPQWQLLPHAHIAQLPALQWRLHNLIKLKRNAAKFGQQHDELAARLERAHMPIPCKSERMPAALNAVRRSIFAGPGQPTQDKYHDQIAWFERGKGQLINLANADAEALSSSSASTATWT